MKKRVKRHAVVQPLDQPYRFIPLTQGRDAIIDAKDFDWLNQWNWSVSSPRNNGICYAAARPSGTRIYMHRIILDCNPGEQCDHKNHNTLDNRRKNLRKCIGAQNSCNKRMPKQNTSGFKGAYWHRQIKKWMAQISVNNHSKYIGVFKSPKDAARAYDEAAKKYYGEFAHLNFQGC